MVQMVGEEAEQGYRNNDRALLFWGAIVVSNR
jgi:hypothetical protein